MRGPNRGNKAIFPAAAATPPAPGLVQNAQGQWGSYQILPGQEVTSWVPYVSPTTLTRTPPGVTSLRRTSTGTGDQTPGTSGTGDQTPGTSGTGDQTPGTRGTGDQTRAMSGTGDVTRVPIQVPQITNPTTPNGYTSMFGTPSGFVPYVGPGTPLAGCVGIGPWATPIRTPIITNLGGVAGQSIQPAGAVMLGQDVNLETVAQTAAVVIGIVLGYKAATRVYHRQRSRHHREAA